MLDLQGLDAALGWCTRVQCPCAWCTRSTRLSSFPIQLCIVVLRCPPPLPPTFSFPPFSTCTKRRSTTQCTIHAPPSFMWLLRPPPPPLWVLAQHSVAVAVLLHWAPLCLGHQCIPSQYRMLNAGVGQCSGEEPCKRWRTSKQWWGNTGGTQNPTTSELGRVGKWHSSQTAVQHTNEPVTHAHIRWSLPRSVGSAGTPSGDQ
jgi:hypothetical protein